VFHRMLQLPDHVRERYDVSSCDRFCMRRRPAGPSETRDDRLARTRALGVLRLTEGGGAIVRPEEFERHPGSQGRPWPGRG